MADPSFIIDLVEKVSKIAGRGMEYKSARKILETDTNDLGPLVEQIEQFAKEKDLESGEIEKLKKIIEANKEVLAKCKIRWWNCFLAPFYQRKLDGKSQEVLRYCSVQLQAQIARDLMKVLSKLSSDDDDGGGGDSHKIQRSRTQTFKGNLGIFPEFTVGLDGPFMNELKSKLLHGDHKVLNLHGLPGSGKTTLAKKLCHDPQVKDKFKKIFFETWGSQFQDNEAINDLQDRLLKLGASPVLLVLDDVRPDSADFVDKLRMSEGSKIFVTSRALITTRGTCGYRMEHLSEDDAKALLLHFVQPSKFDFGDTEIQDI